VIRLVHLLKRKPGLSQAAFTSYWRDVHGPHVAACQTRLDIVRYVQTHRDPAGQDLDLAAGQARGGTQPPYDGLAEFWWKSEAALAVALTSEAGRIAQAALIDDEKEFIDLPASPLWLAHEYPQVNTTVQRIVARPKTGVMKLNFAFHQVPKLSAAEAQSYWLTTHGPLIRSHSAARGLLAYNQVHRYDSARADLLRNARGTAVAPYLGHAEAWFDRLAPRTGPETDDAKTAALADEQNFIDWARSTIIVGKELVFVDRDWS